MDEKLLKKLADEIKEFNYVVQRNWDNLPTSIKVDNHDDLDLFVADNEREDLEAVLRPYREIIPIDVRSERDDYYPAVLNSDILFSRRNKGGFWIPSKENAFLMLYWHNHVHKKDNPYGDKLKKLFFEWMPPVKAKDPGVGYYGPDRQ